MLLTGSWFGADAPAKRWVEAYYPPVSPAFGIDYATLALDEATRVCGSRDAAAPFAYVVTPNAYHVVQHDRNPEEIGPFLDGAWFRLCDSRVVSLLLRVMGEDMPVVPGSELAPALFEHVIQPDDAITILGMDESVVAILRERFKLTNLHHHNPPMGFIKDPAAVQACIDFVADHPARFTFLVLGAMQQEELAFRIARDGRSTGLGLCLGGALEMMTGHKPRAPLWMQKYALEWLYRMAKEPRRIGRRVFNDCLPILGMAARSWLRRRTA